VAAVPVTADVHEDHPAEHPQIEDRRQRDEAGQDEDCDTDGADHRGDEPPRAA
jgi:hypothetical protein